MALSTISDLFVSASSYQSNLAKSCLDTILSIQPKDSSGGGGETREAVVQRLADDMLDKLPENYIAHEVSRKAAVRYQFLNELIVSVKLRNVTSVFSDAGRKKQTNKKKKQEKLYCSLFLHRIDHRPALFFFESVTLCHVRPWQTCR